MKTKTFRITTNLFKETLTLDGNLNITAQDYKTQRIMCQALLQAQGERYTNIVSIDYDKLKIAWNDPEIDITINYN